MLTLSYYITLLLLCSQHDVAAFQTRSGTGSSSSSTSSSQQSISSATNQQQKLYQQFPSKQIIALSILQQTRTKLHMSDSDDGVSFHSSNLCSMERISFVLVSHCNFALSIDSVVGIKKCNDWWRWYQ